MKKEKVIILGFALAILLLGIGLTVFKKCHKSEVEKLVDRYWEIQDEYNFHEGEIAKLHSEADGIREIALDKYGIVFTEAGLETVK